MSNRRRTPPDVLKATLIIDVRPWREREGHSLRDLEWATGISHGTLNDIEKYKSDPPLTLFPNLAEGFGGSPYDYFGFVGYPRPHCCHCEHAKESHG